MTTPLAERLSTIHFLYWHCILLADILRSVSIACKLISGKRVYTANFPTLFCWLEDGKMLQTIQGRNSRQTKLLKKKFCGLNFKWHCQDILCMLMIPFKILREERKKQVTFETCTAGKYFQFNGLAPLEIPFANVVIECIAHHFWQVESNYIAFKYVEYKGSPSWLVFLNWMFITLLQKVSALHQIDCDWLI